MSVRALAERALAPGYGWCYHCGRPWKFVEGHCTPYAANRSCFPLCEGCWAALETPEARLPYYRMLWSAWLTNGPVVHAKWDHLERVVMEGL